MTLQQKKKVQRNSNFQLKRIVDIKLLLLGEIVVKRIVTNNGTTA